jgi:hypothetical protein
MAPSSIPNEKREAGASAEFWRDGLVWFRLLSWMDRHRIYWFVYREGRDVGLVVFSICVVLFLIRVCIFCVD